MSKTKANQTSSTPPASSSIQATVRDELRARYPALAREAAGNGRMAAIKLHCLECMGGGMRSAVTCESRDCFLWPHWPARRRKADSSPHQGTQNGFAQKTQRQRTCTPSNVAQADLTPASRS